jgi:hypothetical protein
MMLKQNIEGSGGLLETSAITRRDYSVVPFDGACKR